jgi:putative ABC transport system permease protein
MLKHNLLLVYRGFKRFKTTFFINLIGLSTGLTCVLMIYLWVKDELEMDRFHEKGKRLYRVMVNNPNSEEIETSPSTQAILAQALKDEIPEIENAVASTGGAVDLTMTFEDQHIPASTFFADKDFFTIFSFELVHGNRNQLLSDKKGIAISESIAIALFNSVDNAVGKTIEWQFPYGKNEVIVSGVFKDIAANSSMKFDAVLSFEIYKDLIGKESLHWGNFGCSTFILLKEGTEVSNVNQKIKDFIIRKAADVKITLFLAPYSEYYLYSTYVNGVLIGGRIEYVKLFSIIGIFILVIACINFMNLATAKATRRIKEVGIKKAIGASRRTLIIQYLAESTTMALLSLAIALLFVDLLLPQFNSITGKELDLRFSSNLVLSLVGVITITGLLAGSYPAFYLSRYNPAVVLKGSFNTQRGTLSELLARKGLIIFQFTLSVIFIVAVLVVYKQVEFVQTTYLGYEKDNIVYFKPEGKLATNLETFLVEARKMPGVINASSIARSIVGAQNSTVGYFHWEGKDPDAIIPFEIVNSNYDLIETLGIKMKEGRSLQREFPQDTASIIFNEAGLEVMGLKDPIGKIFNLWGKDYRIIGITTNFHFESLHEKVKPLFFKLVPEEAERIMIRLAAGKEQSAIDALGELYQKINPGYSFDYKFLDEEYLTQYSAEKRVATLSKYFAGLAIVISCLGLFGLAAFTAERRLKEIGIRKVLGSSSFGIVYLLSSDFTKVVIVSIAIALPVSYFVTEQWLASFAFRITLQWWYFAGAGLVAISIAWLTVGTQAVKAAMANPAQCLKDE